MAKLFYNGKRLRNDAESLARQIGVDSLPQYYDFGVYAGWTRGEVENWHHFANLIARTEAFFVHQGMESHRATFHLNPSQSATGCLMYALDSERIVVEDKQEFAEIFAAWEAWSRTYQEIFSRQPMLRLEELVSDYCRNSEEGWSHSWFYAFGGQCKLLDWAERDCADPLPFKEMKPVVTPAFRRELAEIRARRVGWLLDLGDERDYHLVYCNEDEVADFRRKHCAFGCRG